MRQHWTCSFLFTAIERVEPKAATAQHCTDLPALQLAGSCLTCKRGRRFNWLPVWSVEKRACTWALVPVWPSRLPSIPRSQAGWEVRITVPQKMATSSSLEYGKKGLCKCDKVKDPELGDYPGLSVWALNAIKSVLIWGKKGLTRQEAPRRWRRLRLWGGGPGRGKLQPGEASALEPPKGV